MQLTNKSYANRGMNLEQIVNTSNNVYRRKRMAAVFKVPTPTKVLYKNMNGYRVPVKAFYESKSWLDYVGIVNGKGVTFDAKETNSKTSFPLSNVKPHQVEAMKIWHSCGGIAFFIVWWKQKNEFYLLPYEPFMRAWHESEKGGRKSIKYECFQNKAIRIRTGNDTYLDWLTAYKTLYGA